jgi:hypothetical protein
MSVNHEIEKPYKLIVHQVLCCGLERNCNVVFFKLLYGFYFLDAIPSYGIIPDMHDMRCDNLCHAKP